MRYGIHAGTLSFMAQLKKITVLLPEDLLRKAQESSGQGITPTIRQGLELVAAGRAYDRLRRLRGQVKLSITTARLRDDRS